MRTNQLCSHYRVDLLQVMMFVFSMSLILHADAFVFYRSRCLRRFLNLENIIATIIGNPHHPHQRRRQNNNDIIDKKIKTNNT
jgi:hypothetical protein